MTTTTEAHRMRAQIEDDFSGADMPPALQVEFARKRGLMLAAFDALLSIPLDAPPYGPNGLAVAAGLTIPEVIDALDYLTGDRCGLLRMRLVFHRADGSSIDVPPATLRVARADRFIDPVDGSVVPDWMEHVTPILDPTERLQRMVTERGGL